MSGRIDDVGDKVAASSALGELIFLPFAGYNRLTNEIFGCEHGGSSVVAGWYFR